MFYWNKCNVSLKAATSLKTLISKPLNFKNIPQSTLIRIQTKEKF